MDKLAKGILHSPYLLCFVTLGVWIGFLLDGDIVKTTRATYFLLGVTTMTLVIAYIMGVIESKWTSQ